MLSALPALFSGNGVRGSPRNESRFESSTSRRVHRYSPVVVHRKQLKARCKASSETWPHLSSRLLKHERYRMMNWMMHHDAVWPQRDWFWISSAIKQTLFRMRPCEGKWPWLSALNFSRDVHIISSPVVANIIMGHVPHKILPGYCHALPSLWRSSPGSADPWSSRYPWDDTAQSEFRRQEDPPRRTKLGKLCQMMLTSHVWKILKHLKWDQNQNG